MQTIGDLKLDFSKAYIFVLGAARSGISAVKFILSQGGRVCLCDTKSYSDLFKMNYGIETIKEKPDVTLILGRQPTEDELRRATLIVLSPGVPPDCPPLQTAASLGIPVMSEIEFANCFFSGSIVAITGTNGKTTTTALTHYIFSHANLKAFLGGNIGNAFINCVCSSTPESVCVLEISSFQLDLTQKLKPHVAVITNITPDHLDRHKTMENYINAKAKVFQNMDFNDFLILNRDDPTVRFLASRAKCNVLFFTLQNDPSAQAYFKDDTIWVNFASHHGPVVSQKELKLYGRHNVMNVMCAVLSAFVYGIDVDVIRSSCMEFRAVQHRIEYVDTVNGVEYINDSKGTNPDSTLVALESMQKPVVLILGGYDKNADFSSLIDPILRKVKYIVLLGQVKEKIANILDENEYTNYEIVSDFDACFAACKAHAKPGDVVLLSPACASWGMFDDYEQRGRMFKQKVKALKGE